MDAALTHAPSPTPNAAFFTTSDGAAVIDQHGGRLYEMNPTAGVIWQCLDGDGTLGEIAEDLAASFNAAPSAIVPDLLATVDQFVRRAIAGLVGSPLSTPISTSRVVDH